MGTNSRLRKEIKRQKRVDSIALKVLLVIVVLAIAAYLAGTVYFTRHFYTSGTVFGIEMRNKTVDVLKQQVRDKVGEYQMTIVTRDGEEQILASDVGMDYDDKGEIEALLENQNAFLWPFMGATALLDQDIEITVDDQALNNRILGLSCMKQENMTPPEDAYLVLENGRFVIKEEQYGNQLDISRTTAVLADAVKNGAVSIDLDESGCYVMPKVFQEDKTLLEQCEKVNNIIDIEITYDFGDRQIVADGDTIAEWITFGEDGSVTVDQAAVEAFVKNMAYQTDTFGLSRTFKTHSGSTVNLKGGDYGWCINRPKTTEALMEYIAAGESVTVEPVYRYKGVCRDTNDIGQNYVEVSISEQRMWVYHDGTCVVDTPVVTGNTSKQHDTPSGGVWAVDARIGDYMLTGQDYNTHVDYWLPFNGNVGIHDATWRSEFGGTIYQTSGSHGCVNTPLEAMKTVYANVKIGYPVVVY